MTHRSTWKAAERRIAALFGTTRNPLSGGNSKHTRSDSLHDFLFIETKYRQSFALIRLYESVAELAAREDKMPVLVLVERKNYQPYVLAPLGADYLEQLVRELKKVRLGEPEEAGEVE